MKVAEVIVKILESEGIKAALGIPGAENSLTHRVGDSQDMRLPDEILCGKGNRLMIGRSSDRR